MYVEKKSSTEPSDDRIGLKYFYLFLFKFESLLHAMCDEALHSSCKHRVSHVVVLGTDTWCCATRHHHPLLDAVYYTGVGNKK